MTANIILRSASIDDLRLLKHWDEQPHVMAADPNDDWNWEVEFLESPPWRQQYIAELNGRAIGFIQIIDPAQEASHYWGQIENDLRAIDIWIGEQADLGQGYGSRMMQLALSLCFAASEVKAVLVDPLAINHKAHQFYRKLGFRFVQQRQFGEDLCHVFSLNRDQWKQKFHSIDPAS